MKQIALATVAGARPMIICDRCGRQCERKSSTQRFCSDCARDPDRIRERDHKRERQQYHLSKARWHYQSIRLDHDDAETLRAIAKRDGTTVPELIRTFIAWGLENDYGGADRE